QTALRHARARRATPHPCLLRGRECVCLRAIGDMHRQLRAPADRRGARRRSPRREQHPRRLPRCQPSLEILETLGEALLPPGELTGTLRLRPAEHQKRTDERERELTCPPIAGIDPSLLE